MISDPGPPSHGLRHVDIGPWAGSPTPVTSEKRQSACGPDIDGTLRLAYRAFEERFSRPPRFAAAAPGRVNLIGEHTDYSGGFVLPIAIDRQAVIVADLTDVPSSTLLAIDLNEAAQVDLREPLTPRQEPRWPNYLLGVGRQFQERGLAPPNLDVAFTSTVPIGAGLSSSAAIEVAMATLLEQIVGAELDPVDKALLCQRAEHAFPGTPCGIMDMFIATMASPDHALLIDCRSNEARPIRMPPPERAALMIVDTGVKHELAAGIYAARRATCEQAAARLGLASLRDATIEMLDEGRLTQAEHQRAMHVVRENERTRRAAQLLEAGDVEMFGELMFQSHASLRYLYEVSCPELDTLIDAAEDLRGEGPGVYGARMTGGGFGGCAIVLCHPQAVETVEHRLRDRYRTAHGRQAGVFSTRAAGSARALLLSPHP
jgi:galactokinase